MGQTFGVNDDGLAGGCIGCGWCGISSSFTRQCGQLSHGRLGWHYLCHCAARKLAQGERQAEGGDKDGFHIAGDFHDLCLAKFVSMLELYAATPQTDSTMRPSAAARHSNAKKRGNSVATKLNANSGDGAVAFKRYLLCVAQQVEQLHARWYGDFRCCTEQRSNQRIAPNRLAVRAYRVMGFVRQHINTLTSRTDRHV
jgi:hypothetical protein